MEEILARYRGNWETQVEEFTALRDDMAKGREDEARITGLSKQELPFFDLIIESAYEDVVINDDEMEKLKELTKSIVELLKDAIDKPDFWRSRDSEIRKLRGELDDILDFCDIEQVSNAHEKISVEVMTLAKRRHDELTGE